MPTSRNPNRRSKRTEEGLECSDLGLITLEALAPPRQLTVSEWAEEYRILPPASAEPGPWRNSRVPYMREVMDVLSPSHPAQFVTVMKGSQTAGTEAGNNWIGFVIGCAPSAMMLVLPGLPEVKWITRERINRKRDGPTDHRP